MQIKRCASENGQYIRSLHLPKDMMCDGIINREILEVIIYILPQIVVLHPHEESSFWSNLMYLEEVIKTNKIVLALETLPYNKVSWTNTLNFWHGALVFDIHHMGVSREISDEWINIYQDRIVEVHVRDYDLSVPNQYIKPGSTLFKGRLFTNLMQIQSISQFVLECPFASISEFVSTYKEFEYYVNMYGSNKRDDSII